MQYYNAKLQIIYLNHTFILIKIQPYILKFCLKKHVFWPKRQCSNDSMQLIRGILKLSCFCLKILCVIIVNLHVLLQIPPPSKLLYCTRSANRRNDTHLIIWQWDCSTQSFISSYTPQSSPLLILTFLLSRFLGASGHA